MIDLLKSLIDIPAVSGFEYRGQQRLGDIVAQYVETVEFDAYGNCFGRIKTDGPRILIDAHFDTLGLMVKSIEDGGFLTFGAIGGIDPRTLIGASVTVLGDKAVYGVIGSKPPHILSAEDMKKAIKMEDLCIDTGYEKTTLEEMVSVGDCAVFNESPLTRLGQHRITSRYLDDRAGVAVALQAAKRLQGSGLDITALVSVCEETNRLGAKIAAKAYDLALVIDVTHGETPDAMPYRTVPLGGGAAICKGPSLHGGYTNRLIELLKKQDLPHQIEVEQGDPGTNSWMLQTTGTPCVMISIPLRYMHTGVETADLRDLDACIEAACAGALLVKGGDAV